MWLRIDNPPVGIHSVSIRSRWRSEPAYLEWRRKDRVLAVDLVQSLLQLELQERAVRHHFPAAVLDEPIREILGDLSKVPSAWTSPPMMTSRFSIASAIDTAFCLATSLSMTSSSGVVAGEEGEEALQVLAFNRSSMNVSAPLPCRLSLFEFVLSRTRTEKPPAATKTETAGGSKNSRSTFIVRHFSSSVSMIWREVSLRSDRSFKWMRQVPADESRSSVRI